MGADPAGPTEAGEVEIASPRNGSGSGGRSLEVQEAAVELFSALGYHGTTMKDVAARLGVRAPSLYNHVLSKQEILQRVMINGMQVLMSYQQSALAKADGAEQQICGMTEAHVLMHATHPKLAIVGDRELGNLEEPTRREITALREAYEHTFRAAVQRGARTGIFQVRSPKLASFAIIEMASSVAVWFDPAGSMAPEDVARAYGELALRIVGAQG